MSPKITNRLKQRIKRNATLVPRKRGKQRKISQEMIEDECKDEDVKEECMSEDDVCPSARVADMMGVKVECKEEEEDDTQSLGDVKIGRQVKQEQFRVKVECKDEEKKTRTQQVKVESNGQESLGMRAPSRQKPKA